MNSPKPLKVSKFNAARRQLHTAIELWVNDGDAISIHALAFNAHDLLCDLNKKRKTGAQTLFDVPNVKDEFKQTIINSMRQPGNFFKHSDRDPNAIIDFHVMTNDMFMIASIALIQPLGETLSPLEMLFFGWFSFQKPRWFEGEINILIKSIGVEGLSYLAGLNKKEFFKDGIEHIARSGVIR